MPTPQITNLTAVIDLADFDPVAAVLGAVAAVIRIVDANGTPVAALTYTPADAAEVAIANARTRLGESPYQAVGEWVEDGDHVTRVFVTEA